MFKFYDFRMVKPLHFILVGGRVALFGLGVGVVQRVPPFFFFKKKMKFLFPFFFIFIFYFLAIWEYSRPLACKNTCSV